MDQNHPSHAVPLPLLLRCYRHGESEANAGAATTAPDSIPLTPKGHSQAAQIASSLEWAPDLVISSPFRRAQETAAPSLLRFKGVRHEVWPVQEFTYLAPVRCIGTTLEQRRPWTTTYWEKGDPDFLDGNGSESFSGFVRRVHAARQRMEELHGAGLRRAVLFGHAQFILAMKMLVSGTTSIDMRCFRHLDLSHPIRNGEAVDFKFDGCHWSLDS